MSVLVNIRRVASLAVGFTVLAASLMLTSAPGHAYGGGGHRFYGGGHRYGGGARAYVSRIGFAGRGWYGGRGYYGGARYRAPRYYYGGPRYYAPRSYVSFGFGVGVPAPYYHPYPYYYAPPPAVVYRDRVIYKDRVKEQEAEPEKFKEEEAELDIDIDVTNEPPSGTFYFDSYCGQEFKNLDACTDHLDDTKDRDHPNAIEIVDKDSRERIGVLEFDGDSWKLKKGRK